MTEQLSKTERSAINLDMARRGHLPSALGLLGSIKSCLKSGEQLTPAMTEYLIEGIENTLPKNTAWILEGTVYDANKAFLLKPTASQKKKFSTEALDRLGLAIDVEIERQLFGNFHKEDGGACKKVGDKYNLGPSAVENIYKKYDRDMLIDMANLRIEMGK